MVRFIFGRAMSGKTAAVLKNIKADTENGQKQVVLLVPEQSSFDYERALLHTLGDGGYTLVPVLSFTRLLDEVGRFCGDLVGRHLTECGKAILMSRAMRAAGEELCVFGRYSSNIGFIGNVITVIDEFKRCGIDSGTVRSYADKLKGSTLSRKLRDIALLYDTYDGLLKGRYIDPSDDMLRLHRQLSEYSYFSEKTVYVDAFKNFTGAQLKIVEQIISRSDDVTFSFCFDPDGTDNVFYNVSETVKQITDLAKKHGVPVAAPEILGSDFHNSAALRALEHALCGKGGIFEGECDSVTVCAADTLFDEAEFVANEIRRLVRTEGYRYRDFAVISRDDEQYRRALQFMCERYGVPLFKDKLHNINHMAFSVFLTSAMRACDGFTTEDIMAWLKTELADLSFDEVSELENYVYVWKIDRGDWKREWTMNPDGLSEFTEKCRGKLERINALRRRAVEPLIILEREFCGTATEMSHALWRFIERCGIMQKLRAMADDEPDSDLIAGGYDAVIEILDSLCDTLGDEKCKRSEYIEYFNLALSSARIGTIPQMLDEVTFGAADRIKPRNPKVVFVLGLNQGIFPAVASQNGIIGANERNRLLGLGMPISDFAFGFSVDEEYLIYTTLCCASDKLYACYCNTDSKGTRQQPSSAVTKIESILPACRRISFGRGSFTADRVETADAAFAGLMRTLDNSRLCLVLTDIYSDNEEYSRRINGVKRIISDQDKSLSLSVSERVFGKNMYLSATSVNTYFSCQFAYFCKYGLGAKVIKPAEIDVLQRGTIIHAVLEKLIIAEGVAFSSLSDDEIKTGVNAIIDDYISSIPGVEQIRDANFEYIVSRIRKLTVEVMCHMRNEFAQSDFVPVKCEMKIGGDDADVEETVVRGPDGSVILKGAIDRVDRCGPYIRVVDYKTGIKDFSLSDVFYGLNMQMLLYLYALLRSKEYKDCLPAGVLYLVVRNKIEEESSFKTNGILLEDMQVQSYMDKANMGEFVPRYRLKKDGTPYKDNNSHITAETFCHVFEHIEGLLRRMNSDLLHGKIPVHPRDSKTQNACKYCDFATVCGHENKAHDRAKSLSKQELVELFKEGADNV